MLRVRKVRVGGVARGAATAEVRHEEKLLSSDEIEGLMDAFAADGPPPPSVRTVAPASGCVRAAPDDGIEELVDGIVEGWGDDVA